MSAAIGALSMKAFSRCLNTSTPTDWARCRFWRMLSMALPNCESRTVRQQQHDRYQHRSCHESSCADRSEN